MENNKELQDEQDLTHGTNIQTLELCEKREDVLLAN
jgi:hypothetical protein